MTTVLIVHFTPPGIIGGVEHIIQQHRELLRARGYRVEVVAGSEGDGDAVHVIPEIQVAGVLASQVEAELAAGNVTARFHEVCRTIERLLVPLMDQSDVIIVHNALTLHFSLPLTAVVWEYAARRAPGDIIAWSHDLSWTNPLYLPSMHRGYPWELLRKAAPNTQYVTVSGEREMELAALWGQNADAIRVVPNGVDVARFLRLSPATAALADRYRLFDRDAVLLLPVRITRRKNVQLGIQAIGALRDRGLDVVFLVSGPTAPHHPGLSDQYLQRLKGLCHELALDDRVIFLADVLGHNLDDRSVSELFAVSDILLFPSEQEGFGIPILEAGLARLPVVLSDIPIFREVGGDETYRFSLEDSPDTIARHVVRALDLPTARLYRRVVREYRWDAIVDRHILPLLPPAGETLSGA